MKLIVPLDITIFESFLCLFTCFYFVEFGWIRSATNHEICVLKDK